MALFIVNPTFLERKRKPTSVKTEYINSLLQDSVLEGFPFNTAIDLNKGFSKMTSGFDYDTFYPATLRSIAKK